MSGLGASVPTVHQDEIDGVTTFWADVPGPFIAALVFRVGRADESLATSGITHLVEHLALPGDFHEDYDHNGMVDQTQTTILARGEHEEVAALLETACRRLGGGLPLETMEQEINVLLTEQASMGPNPVADMHRVRFGPRGYGLVGEAQIGLHRLNATEVDEWARRFFTSGNAVLVTSGRPPASMRLPLPPGARQPPPVPQSLPQESPLWFGLLGGMVGLSVIGTRDSGLDLAMRSAARRVHDNLRRDRGLTYSASVVDEPLGWPGSHHALLADCIDQHAVAVRDGVLTALDEVATHGPTDAEIRKDRAAYMRDLAEPGAFFGWLLHLAERELAGAEIISHEDYLARFHAIGVDQARDELASALGTALLLVPDGVPGPEAPWQPIPAFDDPPLSGVTYRPGGLARFRSGERIIVGDDGISLSVDGGRWLSIRWSDVTTALHVRPGFLSAIGLQGGAIEIDLPKWHQSDRLVADILGRVPEHLHVVIDDPAAS